MIECFARTLPEQLYNFSFWEVLVIFYCGDTCTDFAKKSSIIVELRKMH